MKQHQTNTFISRAAAMLLTVIMAFAGAQTAWAQNTCDVTFYISSGGTVELPTEYEWLEVTNGDIIVCNIPSVNDLTITPETGYYVSSVTYDAPAGLSIDLNQRDDFHWYLYINSYEGSETPTITVHIVFDKALAGGADEASAVALTADDDLSRLTGGWYKVESDLTFGHTVNLHGDTHITIATGKTLTVNTSDEYGISGSALTVSGEGMLNVSANQIAISVDNYTQTGCAVTLSGETDGLTAENNVSISGGSLTTSGADIETNQGAITISGGTVSASGDQCGLYACDAVSITGGTVSASGNNYGIRGYSVSITGGQVTASSGGIWSNYGDITLGCTSATDYITASGYVLQNDGFYVKIADGQTLYGGGFPSASYKGTVDDPSALNGLMLRPTAAVTKSGTNEYTIWNAAGWDAFCDALQDNDTYNRFSGKTVRLGDDITVTRMAGSDHHDFCGTFDGQEHTLTFNYNTAENDAAPFRYVEDGCVIENLRVCGTIETSAQNAAGFISDVHGNATIRNSLSNVTINSTVSGDGTHAGLVAANSGTLNITGCAFTGSLLTTNGTTHCAGFVGYNGGTLNITNSLYAPASVSVGTTESATFARGEAPAITNSYYTSDFNDGSSYTGQGKQLRTIAAGENVTVGHAGEATTYSVSGITAYKASGAHGDSDPFIAGILYDEVLYAGSGDEVSMTLANSSGDAPAGYQYSGDYSASGGATLSGSTLTMADEDVTVSFTPGALRSTGVAVPVSYVDAGGNTQTAQAIALDGTETDTVLGRNGEETWYFVGLPTVAFDHQLLILYDINLILADGCTMNVTSTDGTSCINVKNNLHIYGQAEGTGILNAQKQDVILSSEMILFIEDGTLGIHGGNVIATYTGTAKNVNAIYFSRQDTAGDVLVIDGGTLTANGNDGYGIFINGGDARINGGQVTATGGNSGIAVSSRTYFLSPQRIPSTLTLSGGTLTASSIETFSGKDKEGTIAVAPGYTYTDGSNIYDSTTASADLAALTKVTLWPYLALADAADNTAAIADHAGQTLAVALSGRTLYKDGAWNTLCLPFAIDDFDGTPLEGATVKELNATTSNLNNGTLTLNFSDNLTAIEAGTPYIVKWAKADGYDEADPETRDVKNPVFTGVTISGTEPTPVNFTGGSFVGQYSTFKIGDVSEGDDGNLNEIIMLSSGNKLGYSQNPRTLRSFRAHFEIPTHTGAPAMNSFVIDFGDESTGISLTPDPSPRGEGSEYYTLDGRKLNGKPTQKGVYVNNGKKIVIK